VILDAFHCLITFPEHGLVEVGRHVEVTRLGALGVQRHRDCWIGHVHKREFVSTELFQRMSLNKNKTLQLRV
jgi:hypothetical protein